MTNPDKPVRYNPVLELTLARVREFFREPAAVFWVYGFPLLLAFALGIAFRNRPVEKVRVDVVHEAATERLTVSLAADPRLDVRHGTEDECRARLRTAKTDLVVTPGKPGEPPTLLVDPNRPECVLAKGAVEAVWQRGVSGQPALPETTIDEPGGRYIDFLIPGLIGTNLMGGGLWGVGFVTVDMRVRKLLKRFLATPMRKRDFLVSLVLSRLLFTLIEIAILIVFAAVFFDVRVRGSVAAFAVLATAGGACFAGIGLLVASRAQKIETVSGLMNAVMLPMYVVSGVFFSADRFPQTVQPLIQLLPLTTLIDGLRAVMNDGEGLSAVLKPSAILAAWGGASFALALRLFRWR